MIEGGRPLLQPTCYYLADIWSIATLLALVLQADPEASATVRL